MVDSCPDKAVGLISVDGLLTACEEGVVISVTGRLFSGGVASVFSGVGGAEALLPVSSPANWPRSGRLGQGQVILRLSPSMFLSCPRQRYLSPQKAGMVRLPWASAVQETLHKTADY